MTKYFYFITLVVCAFFIGGCASSSTSDESENANELSSAELALSFGTPAVVSIGQLGPNITPNTPIAWANAISNQGLAATINETLLAGLASKGLSAVAKPGVMDPNVVATRFQLVYFFDVDGSQYGDTGLFSFSYPGVSGKFVIENSDLAILSVVDISLNKMLWRASIELPSTETLYKEEPKLKKAVSRETFNARKAEYMVSELIDKLTF